MLTKLQKMRSKKGFTLMELLIVIAIIVILVAIIIPVMNGQTQKARVAADKANARSATAIIAYYALENEEAVNISTLDDWATVLTNISGDALAQLNAIQWQSFTVGASETLDDYLTVTDGVVTVVE